MQRWVIYEMVNIYTVDDVAIANDGMIGKKKGNLVGFRDGFHGSLNLDIPRGATLLRPESWLPQLKKR